MTHSLSTSVENSQLPGSGGRTSAEVEIEPGSGSATDLPLHVVFCVDSSSSMSGSPIRTVKSGVAAATDHLSSRDEVGVVDFASDAGVVLDPVSGDRDDAIEDAVSGISTGGRTNIIDGLAKSRDLLQRMSGGSFTDRLTGGGGSDAIQWIGLLTDGAPNETNLRPFEVRSYGDASETDLNAAVASELNDDGITVHSAGVGGYNREVIEALSVSSGGEWEHLDSASEIGVFFRDLLQDAQNVVATDPVLELTPRNGATLDNIVQQVPQIADPNIEAHGDRFVVNVPDINVTKPPRYSFDVAVPELDTGKKTVVDVELTVGSDRLTDTIDVKVVSAALRDENAGDETVGLRHEKATDVSDRSDSMSDEEYAEETRTFLREGD